MQKYKIITKNDNGHEYTVIASGTTKQRAINYAQRLLDRKFGLPRITFHTNLISVTEVDVGLNFGKIKALKEGAELVEA